MRRNCDQHSNQHFSLIYQHLEANIFASIGPVCCTWSIRIIKWTNIVSFGDNILGVFLHYSYWLSWKMWYFCLPRTKLFARLLFVIPILIVWKNWVTLSPHFFPSSKRECSRERMHLGVFYFIEWSTQIVTTLSHRFQSTPGSACEWALHVGRSPRDLYAP